MSEICWYMQCPRRPLCIYRREARPCRDTVYCDVWFVDKAQGMRAELSKTGSIGRTPKQKTITRNNWASLRLKNTRQKWPDQECACGCKLITKRATYTKRAANYIKGKPLTYIQGHNSKR